MLLGVFRPPLYTRSTRRRARARLGRLFGRIAAFWGEREAAPKRKRLRDQFRPPFRRARPPAPHQIFGFLDFFLPPLRRSAQLQILSLLQEHRA